MKAAIVNRGYYALIAIFAGMLTTHILASVHIYLANTDLYWTLDALGEQGYLVIPNRIVMQSLLLPGSAFSAAVMFTLSIGAALSSFTFAAVWVWDRLFSRKQFVLILLLMLWALCVFIVNSRGISLLATCYFILVPAVTAAVALKLMPEQSGGTSRMSKIVHIVSFILVSILCMSQLSGSIFVEFRDNFFLSNPVGMKMNDFYYKYTLYAAEVIKPLDQKTIKTSSLNGMSNETDAQLVNKVLHDFNYLSVNNDSFADLTVVEQGNEIVFENRGSEILRTTVKNFLAEPGYFLLKFSNTTDRMAFFRTFILISLLAGLPLTVYFVLYSLFRLIFSFLMNATASIIVAAVICLLIGIALVFTLESNKEGKVGVDGLTTALESERWQTRMAALKLIEKNGLEVSDYPAYTGMLSSPHVAERYWLAKALGESRRPETFRDLIVFLDDPHTNVVCMAYYSIGKRVGRSYVQEIISRIERSDHWYEQFYGYNALMELGWRQKILN